MKPFMSLEKFRSSLVLKVVSCILLQAFLFNSAVYGTVDNQLPTPKDSQIPEVVTIDDIGVAKDLGTIKERYKGKNGKLIVHIQDAHCNYEAQTNISKIVETLSMNYNVNLISVEGADGYIDTSWFRAFPDAEIRKEVADYFMKKGEITGVEFLSITKDCPIKLYGAETRDLYIKNLEAFTSTYPKKTEIEQYLRDIKTILGRLKNYIYSKELKDFDAKIEEYRSKEMSLSDYAKVLQAKLKRHSIELKNYPDFAKLIYTLVYEDKIDFKVVDQERADVIDTLSKALSKEALQDLVVRSFSFKVGKISAGEYYTYLDELAKENDIDLAKDYANLGNYVIYTRLYERIDNEQLFNELDDIKCAVQAKLYQSDDQRGLSACWDNINILLGLINIKLSNKEFSYFQNNKEEFAPEFFLDFLKAKVTTYNLACDIEEPSEVIAENLPKLEDFYEIATRRDRALVDNTIKVMKKEKTDIAVLVTGGFHTEGIKTILEEKGYSYVVVCPNITKDAESPYIQVLTNQKTPFEELLIESAAPTKEAELLAPFSIAQAIMSEGQQGLTEAIKTRAIGVKRDWVAQYVQAYMERMTQQGFKPERDLDVLARAFLLAYDSTVQQVVESLGTARRVKQVTTTRQLISEAFAHLHPPFIPTETPYITLDQVDVENKTIGVRVDINVTLKAGQVKMSNRIKAAAVTLKELSDRGAKVVVLAHQGRPGDPNYLETMEQHAALLGEEIAALEKARAEAEGGTAKKYRIRAIDDLFSTKAKQAIKRLKPGEIIILKNVRSWAGEQKGEKTGDVDHSQGELVQNLQPLFNLYVIDGFSVAHRASASVVGFTGIPNVAGRLMQKELTGLSRVTEKIEKPYIMSLAGLKCDDYFNLIERACKGGWVEQIITAGSLGQILLMVSGVDIGVANREYLAYYFSELKKESKEKARADAQRLAALPLAGLIKDNAAFGKVAKRVFELHEQYGDKLVAPVDYVVADVDFSGDEPVVNRSETVGVQDIAKTGLLIFDIGPETRMLYSQHIERAKTVYIKGPLGGFDIADELAAGTQAVYGTISKQRAAGALYSFGGGGDTDKAIAATGTTLSYQTLAGGATLQYLEGEQPLFGVERLKKASETGLPWAMASALVQAGSESPETAAGTGQKKIRTPGTEHLRIKGDINKPLTEQEDTGINKAIADTCINGGKKGEVFDKATNGVFVILDYDVFRKYAKKYKIDPDDIICHPGTKGTKEKYQETGNFADVKKRYYMTDKYYDQLTADERRTIAQHEEKHIQIALKSGIAEVPKGMTEEEYVNSRPGCDTRHIMARRFGSTVHMVDILQEADYGDAAIQYIEGVRTELKTLKAKRLNLVTQRGTIKKLEAHLDEFIRTVYMRRWNIESMKSVLSEEPSIGYDIYIISSTTQEEADYQQKALDNAFRGLSTENKYLGKKVCILSVVDEAEGGQVIGQVNTWRRAKEAFTTWATDTDRHGEALPITDLDVLFQANRAKIAIYHNGGKGERASPATQSLGNSRAAQKLVGHVLNSVGDKLAWQLLIGVVLQTSPLAATNEGDRIDTYWANQLTFGTVDFTAVQRSNCAFDKFLIEINRDMPLEKQKKKAFFDYGTARVDASGNRILGFLANKTLAERKKGIWGWNEKFSDLRDLLLSKKETPLATFDFGSFSYSRDMHYALMRYWESQRHIYDIMGQNNGKAGMSRDIDPALVQILVPLLNGLEGRKLSGPLAEATAQGFRQWGWEQKEWLVSTLIQAAHKDYRKPLEKIAGDKKKLEFMFETIEFLLFARDNYPKLYEDLVRNGIGCINLGKDSHWFAYKRLLDVANEKFIMLTDLVIIDGTPRLIAIDDETGELETVPGEDGVLPEADIWDRVRAEDARKARRIDRDNIAVFQVNGETIRLSADQVRAGWWWKEEGSVPDNENIFIQGSVIRGRTVLLPGSRVVDSVVCNAQACVLAENSYVETTTAHRVEARNSVVYKVIEPSGAIHAHKEIVADVYRPIIVQRGKKKRPYAKGQTRMRAPITYDPKGKSYKKIIGSVEGQEEGTVKVKAEDGSDVTFLIRPGQGTHATIQTDGSRTYFIYAGQEGQTLVGQYTQAAPVTDQPASTLTRQVWVERTMTKNITIQATDAVQPTETKQYERIAAKLVRDKLTLNPDHILDDRVVANLEKALEQGEYYAEADGTFAARPESDYVLFGEEGGNEFTFHDIRQMPCNRSKNDKIEHDLRLKMFVNIMAEEPGPKLSPERRLQIWVYAYINQILVPERHGQRWHSLKHNQKLRDLYAHMFGMSGLPDKVQSRTLAEFQELYADVFGIPVGQARLELTVGGCRKTFAYTRLMLGIAQYYTVSSYAEQFGIGATLAENELYDIIAKGIIDRYARRNDSPTVKQQRDPALATLTRILHDRRFADYRKTVQRLLIEAQTKQDVAEHLFYSFKDIPDGAIEGFIHDEMIQDRVALRVENIKEAKMGTSGVRGVADENLKDMEVYIHFRAQARYAKEMAEAMKESDHPLAALIAQQQISIEDIIDLAGDYRPSTPRILVAIAAAFIAEGFKVVDFQGLVPTPALAYHAMYADRARAGVQVTGGRNPSAQNGAKTYWRLGELLKPEEPALRDYVDRIRNEEFPKPESESMFDDNGYFKEKADMAQEEQQNLLQKAREAILQDPAGKVRKDNLKDVRTEIGYQSKMMSEAEKMYIDRYREAFGEPLKGTKFVFYEQSTVGRFTMPLILEALGAEVIRAGRSEKSIPVNTENLSFAVRKRLQKLAEEHNANFVVTADSDAGSPVFCDEKGNVLYGDKLGVLTSMMLGLDFVACPVSANSGAVQLMADSGIKVVLTKADSPFVIEAMHREGLDTTNGRTKRGGFGMTGGFLLGSDITIADTGKTLKALPTRDAMLPIICAALYSIQRNKTASEAIQETFKDQYESYGFAGLVENLPFEQKTTPGCESYEPATGIAIETRLSPLLAAQTEAEKTQYETIGEIIFASDGTVRYVTNNALAGGMVLAASTAPGRTLGTESPASLAYYMQGVRAVMTEYLREMKGMEGVEIEKINYVDGIRIYLSNGEIVHLQTSNDTAQFRISAEAKTQERANEIVTEATKGTSGLLVRLVQAEIDGSLAEDVILSTVRAQAASKDRKTPTAEEGLALKTEASKALLPYLIALLGLRDDEVVVDEESGFFSFTNPDLEAAKYDRGRRSARYVLDRGVLPQGLVRDKDVFAAESERAAYTMFHLKSDSIGELHLATHFPGEATYAGSDVYKMTGSHFQGRNLDYKYVRYGFGLQVISYEKKDGSWGVKLLPLYPGAAAVSLPGTVDIVIDLGGLLFSDRSYKVNDQEAEAIANTLFLSDRFRAALMADDSAFQDTLDAKGMPIVAYESGSQVRIKIHHLYERKSVFVQAVREFNPGFITTGGTETSLRAEAEKIFSPYTDYPTEYQQAVEKGTGLVDSALAQIADMPQLASRQTSQVMPIMHFLPALATQSRIAEDLDRELPAKAFVELIAERAIAEGRLLSLSPSMTEKPWGARVAGKNGLIGEFEFSGKDSRIGVKGLISTVLREHVKLYGAIANNPSGVLGPGVVNAFGTKPVLLKYLTPGTTPRVSDLSRQVHDTKNELWVIARTTVENPQIILGFNQDKLKASGDRTTFLSEYEKALVAFAEALDAVNAKLNSGQYSGAQEARNTHGNTATVIAEHRADAMLTAFFTDEEQEIAALMKAEEELMSFYNLVSVKAGDVIPIPVGTVHALLRGVEVIEPQIEGRTLPLEDGARWPVRYAIEVADGKVKTLKGTDAKTVFDAINLEYEPAKPHVIGKDEHMLLEELGVYPGLTVHRLTLGKEVGMLPDNTREGYHILIAAKGSAIIETSAGDRITISEVTKDQEAPAPVLIPATAGSYMIKPQSDEVQIIKSFAPAKETMKGALTKDDSSAPAPADETFTHTNGREVVLTDQGTTLERVKIVENEPVSLEWLEGKTECTLTVVTGETVEVVNEQGRVIATLTLGLPVTLPVMGTLSLRSNDANTVKVEYPQTANEEQAVFKTVEGIRAALERGDIQRRVTDAGKKGLQILMTHDLGRALYHKGTRADAGHQAHETRFLAEESFLTQYLKMEVVITTGKSLEELLGKVDAANYLPVVWSTEKEIQGIKAKPGVLKGLAKLPLIPISSETVESLAPGQGWFYVRELEGLSLLLSCITAEDIANNETIARDVLRIINAMIAEPLNDISDLASLLPLSEQQLTSPAAIEAKFRNLIQKILITLPAKPFDPRGEIHRRRQVLWSA